MSDASILAPTPAGLVVVESPPVAEPPDRSSASAEPAHAAHPWFLQCLACGQEYLQSKRVHHKAKWRCLSHLQQGAQPAEQLLGFPPAAVRPLRAPDSKRMVMRC